MGKTIILLLIIGIVFYLVYINGFLSIQSKRAILYIGSLKGNSARFSSCTGYSKRVIRFRDSRIYCVAFDSELTKGDVSVEILNSAKQTVACLSLNTPNGRIDAEKGKRYYLLIRFQSATGRYILSWD